MGGEHHREGQSDEPEVEGVRREAHEPALQLVRGVPDGPGHEARENQDREHFQGDPRHIGPEAQVGGGADHRDDHRDEEGGGEVRQAQVAYRGGQVAVQLPGDDPGSGGAGADEADHRTFQQHAARAFRSQDGEAREQEEAEYLDGQGTQMPAAQPDIVRGDLHELEEQQDGNDDPLPFGSHLVQDGSVRFQQGREMIEEIQADARRDGEGEHPVFEELNGFIHAAGA